VLSLTLIKFFYSHRYSLHDRYTFVSLILLLIIIPVTRAGFRAASFRFIGISRFANLSHLKPSSIILDKRPAGATSDTGDDSELLKRSCKFANPSDRIYITPPRRHFYQRCARRYFAISDRNFPSYFIPNRRIRRIYCANINKKYFTVKFYYPALFRYRADITFINRFLDFRFSRQFLR
jgi:hypothetical protein